MKSPKEKVKAKREEILKAALEVFYEKGFAAARLTDITERIGMTTGAIYGHFATKTDLYRAIFDRETIDEARQAILDCYYSDSDVYQVLNNLIDQIVDNDYDELLLAHKHVQIHRELLVRAPPELEDYVVQFKESWELIFANHTQFLERGQAAGVVRSDINADSATRLFYTIMTGHAAWFRQWYDDDPQGKEFREIVRAQLVESLRPPK